MTATKEYLLGVDIGSTNIRCIVYDRASQPVARFEQKLEMHNPSPGHFEIDADKLFDQFVHVVKGALNAGNLSASRVISMGISVQRNTFTCWNKTTGKLYFPLSSWMDTRAAELVSAWNRGYVIRLINMSSLMIYKLSRSPQFAVGSILSLKSATCPARLQYFMLKDAQLQADMRNGLVQFGCIETYLAWRLSGPKRIHVTEPGCASATQFYDPFTTTWSTLTTRLINVPIGMLPELVQTTAEFCETPAELFGAPIAVRAFCADQQASAFGECCFERGDVKCTLGTAAFIDINTGNTPHGSMQSIYPLAGWKLSDREAKGQSTMVFFAEGHVRAAGLLLEWLHSVGLLSDFSALDSVLNSVPIGANGVLFLGSHDSTHETRDESKKSTRTRLRSRASSKPSATTTQLERNNSSDSQADSDESGEPDMLTGAIVGVRLATTRDDLVRAACESIVFGVFKILRIMMAETHAQVRRIRLSGGLSRSIVVMQLLADLSGCVVERASNADEASCFGAAALAGVASGVWTMEELRNRRTIDVECKPDEHRGAALQALFEHWLATSEAKA